MPSRGGAQPASSRDGRGQGGPGPTTPGFQGSSVAGQQPVFRWPCDNYRAPFTCLTVGCTTPCDYCSAADDRG